MLFNVHLANEINYKRNIIQNQFRDSKLSCKFKLANKLKHAIEVEANIHSARLEDEDSYTKYICNKSNNDIKKHIKNLTEAFNFGYYIFKPGHIDVDLIKVVAGAVDPILFNNKKAEYRKGGVRPTGARHTPPYPEKVPYEMDQFLKELNLYLFLAEEGRKKENFITAIEAALFAHFHLARIHPFDDCNGRTSRTIQNIILKYYNFPPPIIYNGEKLDYCMRLDYAVGGYLNRKGIYPNVSQEEYQLF